MLVQDNLNPHTDAVFHQHLSAAQARVLATHFEVRYTPKNASWLNMVELELSAIACQCLHVEPVSPRRCIKMGNVPNGDTERKCKRRKPEMLKFYLAGM